MKVFITIVIDKLECEKLSDEEKVKIIRADHHGHVLTMIDEVYDLVQNDIPVQLRITNLPPRSSEFIKASEM